MISDNVLSWTCVECKKSFRSSLLKIKKEVLYLDQNLYSNAWKKTPEFLKTVQHLVRLSQKQIIICPYSEVHDKETYLIKNLDNQKNLWDFIKKISRGKRFELIQTIESHQLINAYISFLKNDDPKKQMDLYHPIPMNFHDWDNSLQVNFFWPLTNLFKLDEILRHKQTVVNAILKNIPIWRKSNSSFDDDFSLEIKSHGDTLLRMFLKIISSGNAEEMFNNTIYNKIYNLLSFNFEKMLFDAPSEEDAVRRLFVIKNFLSSNHFKYIPYVRVSAFLWSSLKQDVQKRQFLTNESPTEKDLKRVRGMAFDIEHLSVFVPYCNSVFTENRMAEWLLEWSNGNYSLDKKIKIFSKKNLSKFDAYLEELEQNISEEMREELEFVFG